MAGENESGGCRGEWPRKEPPRKEVNDSRGKEEVKERHAVEGSGPEPEHPLERPAEPPDRPAEIVKAPRVPSGKPVLVD